jgi:hypothetical protein
MKINPLEVPRLLQAIASLMRGRTTRVYEQAYEEERRVDRDLLAYYEVLLSHSFLVTIGEHRKDPASTGSTEGRSPNQWLIPGNEIPLVRHCSALAGLDLKLP